MKLTNLNVNGLLKPVGYSFDFLTFSWLVEEVVGKSIKEMEINIYSDDVCTQNVYSSGKLRNASKNLYSLEDISFLQPRTRYYWNISLITDANESATSTSYFETGKMTEAWTGDWLTYEGDSHNSVIFSKCIDFSKVIKDARLYACGLGIYELHLNSQPVGTEKLLPGYHSYDEILQYQTFDLTELLKNKNKIEILTGNGWYKGRFLFEKSFENVYGAKQKMIFELHISYTDGTSEIIPSDLTWQATESYILENSIYDGETVDYRLKDKNLNSVNVIIDPENKEMKSRLSARLNPAIVRKDTIEIKDSWIDKDGDVIMDYGQILTGWVEGSLMIEVGQNVTFQFGELLQNGNFYRENLRTAKQMLKLIGAGKEEYVCPYFTFFGFRYVKVSGVTLSEVSNLKAVVVYSDIKTTASFKSSNESLNQLFSNIMWSQKGNFLDIPTDCPQRDERMGWTGDVTIFANASNYNMDTRAFYNHYLKNLRLEQERLNGSVPFFVPFPKLQPFEGINPFYVTDGASTWADVATVLPMAIYRHFKDYKMLEHHLPIMKGWVDYLRQRDIENGDCYLWDFDRQLGDWLALDNGNPYNPIGATCQQLIASAYYYISVKNVALATEILSDEQATYYHKLQKNIKEAFITKYFDHDILQLEVITQTATALLLKNKLYPTEAARKNLINKLRELLDENNGYLNTGFVGTPALTHALSENGAVDLAYQLVLNENSPSWLYPVRQGATTIWERWNSILPDGKINDMGMNSLNHYAYGSIGDWLFEVMAGIKQKLTKVTEKLKLRIEPMPDQRIQFVEASLETINGIAAVKWSWETDKINLSITVPFNSVAELIIPGKEKMILEAGNYEFKGLIFGRQLKKGAIFDLDGVLVDTAKYHYLAWKEIAEELNIPFTEEDNERLKGVSRMDSLEIILSLNNTQLTEEEKIILATKKNKRYVEFITKMEPSEILPGVVELLKNLKSKNIGISLGSASKNAPLILERTGLEKYFDVIVDGNSVSKAKPDPEVFIRGAEALGLNNEDCLVFEDAEAGCQAAKAANMNVIGLGEQFNLPSSDIVFVDLTEFKMSSWF